MFYLVELGSLAAWIDSLRTRPLVANETCKGCIRGVCRKPRWQACGVAALSVFSVVLKLFWQCFVTQNLEPKIVKFSEI